VTCEVVLDQFPVHQPGQTDQWVLHFELLVQTRAEHLGGLGCAGVGLHGLQNLQENAGPVFVSLQISHHTSAEIPRQINSLRVVQGGLKTVPDPRNLGQKHIRAMVQVWQQEHLAPATIQTYLSFLRGLAMWMGTEHIFNVLTRLQTIRVASRAIA